MQQQFIKIIKSKNYYVYKKFMHFIYFQPKLSFHIDSQDYRSQIFVSNQINLENLYQPQKSFGNYREAPQATVKRILYQKSIQYLRKQLILLGKVLILNI
ncbi:hypothetical protein pb186bvf_014536 [Paramecium bursaria]